MVVLVGDYDLIFIVYGNIWWFVKLFFCIVFVIDFFDKFVGFGVVNKEVVGVFVSYDDVFFCDVKSNFYGIVKFFFFEDYFIYVVGV